jgi:hypothetical protein
MLPAFQVHFQELGLLGRIRGEEDLMYRLAIDQTKIGLVDQRRALQSVIRALSGQTSSG